MLHKNLIGNTCYNASAGSGKTTTIVNTIIDAYNNGIDTSKALILTFESSAKTVMEKRLKKAKVKSMPYVSTIHALAYRILKENSGKYYRVLSDYDQINMISDVLKTYPKDKTKSPYYYISLFSNYNVSARNTKICSMETSELDIFRKYESAKLKKNMIDFGDMLYYGYELLLNKSIQKHYAEIFKYVIVDEYQDMGECAYLMINLLSSTNNNLFVTGDKKQSIYGFSLASPKYIQNFENTHDNTSRVFMNHTYRTPKRLMEAVNYIASDLDDEEITTKSEIVGSITTTQYQNEHEQSEQIISKIKNEMMNINDTAILMRTNSQAIWFQKECILNNIPFYSKKKTFMESAIAKTILSYIRFIDSNMSDISALADIVNRPYRNVPKKTIDTLRKYKNTISFLKTNDRISGISKINDIIKICIAIRERVDNVHQLVNAIVREFDLIRYFSENLYIKDTAEKIEEFRDFLVDIDDIPKILSICDNIYKNRKSKLGLSILTMHSSKGMEFKNVFVVNINNGSIPHQNSDDVMEELRLFYVAITRTIENLYCSYVLFKGNNMIQPSPFMKYLE